MGQRDLGSRNCGIAEYIRKIAVSRQLLAISQVFSKINTGNCPVLSIFDDVSLIVNILMDGTVV